LDQKCVRRPAGDQVPAGSKLGLRAGGPPHYTGLGFIDNVGGAKRGIDVQGVEVEVTGTFGNSGEPARDVSYRVPVHANAAQSTIDDLIRATDSVTEIQNTMRAGCAVRLEQT
jgi:hypothetical protein